MIIVTKFYVFSQDLYEDNSELAHEREINKVIYGPVGLSSLLLRVPVTLTHWPHMLWMVQMPPVFCRVGQGDRDSQRLTKRHWEEWNEARIFCVSHESLCILRDYLCCRDGFEEKHGDAQFFHLHLRNHNILQQGYLNSAAWSSRIYTYLFSQCLELLITHPISFLHLPRCLYLNSLNDAGDSAEGFHPRLIHCFHCYAFMLFSLHCEISLHFKTTTFLVHKTNMAVQILSPNNETLLKMAGKSPKTHAELVSVAVGGPGLSTICSHWCHFHLSDSWTLKLIFGLYFLTRLQQFSGHEELSQKSLH